MDFECLPQPFPASPPISHPSTRKSSPSLVQTPPLDSAKDLFSPSIDRTPTPVLAVSSESQIMASKATLAPTTTSMTRNPSPSPLSWNESGWLAGKFTFAPFEEDSDQDTGRVEKGQGQGRGLEKRDKDKRSSSSGSDHSASTKSTPSTSQEGKNSKYEEEERFKENQGQGEGEEEGEKREPRKRRIGFSKLAPTAQPFVFSPTPKASSSLPFSRVSPIKTSNIPRHSSLPFLPTQSSTSFDTPPHSALPRFDTRGQLIDQGSSYDIADEILQIQNSLGGNRIDNFAPFADEEDDEWTAERQQQFNSMYASPFHSSSERSRASSIASTSSFYGSQPHHSVDRNATVQQLASYFGPSPVDAAPPILPAGFDNFSPLPESYSPQFGSRHGSISSFDSASGVYPPLAHPEPFNLTPEDDLYIRAREIYTTSCCSTLKATPPASKLYEIGAYFDKAMNQENPLAALYGVNSEQTKGFYASPATSGLDETVVKVAAMRGRQNQMLSVQRSAAGQILPGPSPNNRKLELYKTELCRSWEEKGSCRYGFKCQFAHGRDEQRSISRHPKFKSELCRTFAINGSCPYGPRCCFIHQALPGGGGGGGGERSTIPSSTASRADCPSEPVSRLAHRMTSTAVAGAPQRNFGPTLSKYIGSASSASSHNGSALSSLANSPTSSFRPSLGPSSQPQTPDTPSFCDPFGDANIGLGLSLKLGQAPAVHQEPAKSRISRYSLSSQNSSTSLSSFTPSSPSHASSPATSFHPHHRTLSNNSTLSSASSSSGSALSSPYLQRHGSQSSLSSGGGVPSSPLALRPIGSNWLEENASPHKGDVFDWPETEDLITTDDSLGSPIMSRFNRLAFQ